MSYSKRNTSQDPIDYNGFIDANTSDDTLEATWWTKLTSNLRVSWMIIHSKDMQLGFFFLPQLTNSNRVELTSNASMVVLNVKCAYLHNWTISC